MLLNRLIILACITIALAVSLCILAVRRDPPLVSVQFVGLTNNPVGRPPPSPSRLAVCRGATNLCALFWFTNKEVSCVSFDTECAEQKVAGKWIPFAKPSANWSGVEGGLWTKGSGCLYAVGWPPGLATNAVWRLRVRYRNDLPSPQRSVFDRLRSLLLFFKRSRGTFSTEVTL